ncbi:MAG: serine protease [Candidatus Gracilibacteria bacterium]|nr:serine protease [Candidatus Gracilibacteria bacterium]
MKKITYIVLGIIVSTFINTQLSFANDNIENIYKIESYKYNDTIDTYIYEQYGSSIYVKDGLVYTNAHVILNDEKEPFGNYRVCKTIDFKESAQCFSVGKLLYFDTVNDLAVLKIGTTETKGVTFSKKTINIGDTVKVYGYPSNGGDTITYTEGKISGYEKGLYKIDANLDAGNSGGGVFDDDGNLIGMAVSVSVGYTTLGYVIPINKINNFIAKKGESIENYEKDIENSFIQNTTNRNKIIGAKSFENAYISLNGYNPYGLKLNDYIYNNSEKYFFVSLKDKNDDTNIYIMNSKVNGKTDYNLDENIDYNNKELEKSQDDTTIKLLKVKKVKIKNKDAVLSLVVSKDNSIYLNLTIEVTKNNLINATITSTNIKNKSFLNGVKLILKNLNFISNENATENNELLTLDNLKIDKIDGFYILDSINGGILFNYGDINVVSSSSSKNKISDYGKDYTLSETLLDDYYYMNEYYYINDFSIKQSDSGANYIYEYGINNKSKSSAEDKNEDKYYINAYFYDKMDEQNFYLNSFSFTFNENKSKETIDKLLKSVKTNSGKDVFPIGELKVGENVVETQK